MQVYHAILLIVCAVILFVYGLQSFSKEIQQLGADRINKVIGKILAIPLGGFLLGAIFTSIVQSSTMVSSLTVSLVSAGVIGFYDSLLIVLGTNVGNTATAWIVSYQSEYFGPTFIVIGSIVSLIPTRFAAVGKSIFYFGFIFFALSFISVAMEPIKNDPLLLDILSKASNPFLGILYGILVTLMIQSSSVVVGLVIVLISQGIISLDIAIPIVVGANIGTTSTALLLSLKLTSIAKLTALSASLFNVIGVLIILPFFGSLAYLAKSLTDVPSLQVATAFTISNAFTSLFFLLFLKPTIRVLQKHRWYKSHINSTKETSI